MKKKVIIAGLAITVSLLAYYMDWFNYFLILVAIIALIFLVLAGVISVFKKFGGSTFKVPLVIIVLCTIAVTVSLFRPYEEPVVINSGDLNENLEYAYITDQKDRKELRSFIGYLSKMKERDSIRLAQVRELYAENKIKEPIDKFHAAFIFHHSDNSADYKIASKLASEAAQSEELKDEYTVQWLQKAAYDRYMVSIGQPEKYNTQDKLNIDLE